MNPSPHATPNGELIERLSTNLKPVKPWTHLKLKAFGISVFLITLLFGFAKLDLPMRNDPQALWQIGTYLISGSLFCLIAISGSLILASDLVPGSTSYVSKQFFFNAQAFLFLYLLSAGWPDSGHALSESTSQRGFAYPCTLHVVELSIIPILAALTFIKRGLPQRRDLILTYLCLTTVSFGALALPLSCGNSDPWHLLGAHWLGPLVVVAGALAVKPVFRWLRLAGKQS